MSRWKNILTATISNAKQHRMELGLAVGTGLTIGWIFVVNRLRNRSYRNLQRLQWELDGVKRELDFFDQIEGADGAMQHAIWFEYLREEQRISKALKYYQEWTKKSLVGQLFSLPPQRLLDQY